MLEVFILFLMKLSAVNGGRQKFSLQRFSAVFICSFTNGCFFTPFSSSCDTSDWSGIRWMNTINSVTYLIQIWVNLYSYIVECSTLVEQWFPNVLLRHTGVPWDFVIITHYYCHIYICSKSFEWPFKLFFPVIIIWALFVDNSDRNKDWVFEFSHSVTSGTLQ